MRVFRIEREKYLPTTLGGTGASLSKGMRWNSLNTYIVYTSESKALATLEVAVHLDFAEELPTDRYFVEIDVPDEIEIWELKVDNLPKNWDFKPPKIETQFIGDDFIKEKNSAILKVPSCIIPSEYNYLINPNHPDVSRISVISKTPFVFDERFNPRNKKY